MCCALNFSTGNLSIVRAQHFGIFTEVTGSEQAIQGFANTKAYDVQFQAVGLILSCQAYDQGQLVADTGKVTDPAGVIQGVSGVLFEIPPPTLGQPEAVSFTPLEGSFGNMSATNLGRGVIQPQLVQVSYDDPYLEKRKEAASLYDRGLSKESIRMYRDILASAPNDVEALKDLAWILSTSAAVEINDPQAAVELAEQAFEQMIVGFNSRDDRNAIPPNYDKLQIIQVGSALASAYAAAEQFQIPIGAEFAELIKSGQFTEAQVLVGSASVAMVAETVVAWLVEMAVAMEAQAPSEQMGTLVEELKSLRQAIQAEESIKDGRALPGSSWKQ